MASVLGKRTVATVMTALVVVGGQHGIASEQPGSVVSRRDRPQSFLTGRIGPTPPDAKLPPWPFDAHVRSSEDRLLNALREGVARSATFRDLIGALNRSDAIVYLASTGRMRTGFSAYLSHRIVTAGSHRYLKVFVSRELARDRLAAVIAHELQHTREVADAVGVRSSADMRALFTRLDSGGCVLIRSCTETIAAVRLEAAVLTELAAGR
jgi:hypothetical protein